MSAKIATALHAVMSEVGYVQKTGRNEFHKYNYAGEADLLRVLRPAMVHHGLMLIPSAELTSTEPETGNVYVSIEYTLVHKDGDVWPDKIKAVGCGNDKAKNGTVGDKGAYKALTGANKYLLFKLFQIETGDDPERDHEMVPDLPADPMAQSRARYTNTALSNMEKFAHSVPELKKWWADETHAREDNGVVNGTPEYARLFTAFREKGQALAASSNLQNEAA